MNTPVEKKEAVDVGVRPIFKVAIVAPVHIQPSERWIQALDHLSNTATIIIVDDSDGKVKLPEKWDVYDYARQREELGDELYAQFEMFHKSAACKAFGMWLAYKKGFDPVIVIDSDCIVPPDFIGVHIEALLRTGQGWDNPLKGTGMFSRGFPYCERNKPVWAHMGLWEHELDLYGTDRVGRSHLPTSPVTTERQTPGGIFPLSGMNVSFRNDAIPFMLFLPNFMHNEEKFTRHDDIWGGYIFQKIARAKGFALSYGAPFVYHDTVVIPEEDAKDEEAMIKYEEDFYFDIDDAIEFMNVNGLQCAVHGTYFEELAKTFEQMAVSPVDAGVPVDFPFKGLIPAFKFWSAAFKQLNQK